MPTTIRVPALHDRHGHTSLYASFADCANLAGLDAAASIAALQNLDPARLSVAFGWHSARAPLSDADLAALPPVVIVNISMHGYCLSAAATSVLADDQQEITAAKLVAGYGVHPDGSPGRLVEIDEDRRRVRMLARE